MDARTDESNLAGTRARAKPRAADAPALLAWYDEHRRALPWRAAPGMRPDPYRVWLSEIMLQQTRVETVAPLFREIRHALARCARACGGEALRSALGLGRARLLRASAQPACLRARDRAARRGISSGRERSCVNLPGIGAYTAAAVAAIAFEAPTIAIDGNVERVVARLFALREPLPKAKAKLRALAGRLQPEGRHGDFAQALMELGATVCTPRKPDCPRLSLARCVYGERARQAGAISAQDRESRKASSGAERRSSFGARTAPCSCARGRRKDCSAG